MTEPAIKLNSISKSFSRNLAVDEVTLSIKKGERFVIFGCSGAGKSTLVRIIAGLESPDMGKVFFDGIDFTRKPPSERGIALLNQSPVLYPRMTVQQNLFAALKAKRIKKSEANERIASLLDQFSIASLANHLPSQISGGEAQRAALAKAMIVEPNLLLLDEPLSQLDARNRGAALKLLNEVSDRFQPTTLMVSHDPIDALQFADTIAILHDGRLVDCGAASRVYSLPSCRIAGELLSPFGMNWIDREQFGGMWRRFTEHLPDEERKRYVGFRCEAAHLQKDQKPQSVSLPVQVLRNQSVGFSRVIDLAAEQCQFRVLLDANFRESEDDYKLCVPHESIHCVEE